MQYRNSVTPPHGPNEELVEDRVRPDVTNEAEGEEEPQAAEMPREYVKVRNVTSSGATAPDGTPWVKIEPLYSDGAPSVWTRLADWMGNAAPAQQRMLDENLLFFGDDMKDCVETARSTRRFPPLPLLDRPGWTRPHFALPSSEVYSPASEEPAIVLFRGEADRYAAKGTKAWLTEVHRLARGQSIITFALMIPFMGPILRLSRVSFNPGFELTGPRRVGKSTLQQLVASVVGSAVAQDGKNAILGANTTTNALEMRLGDHDDFILIIEEMSLFYADAGEKAQGTKLRDLVFKLASGTVKSRYGVADQRPARFVYLTSSNETLSGLIGSSGSRTAAAAGARLMTLPIDAARPFGIFDKLPKGFETSEAAVRAIGDLIEDHHGQPIRRFISQLVNDRAASEKKLKRRIARYMDKFRAAVGVDRNDGAEISIADVFGLAYAAGMLAKRYGALPEGLKCLSAAVKVYRMNRELGDLPPSHIERLRRLTLSKGIIKVDPKRLADISNSDIAAAPAFLRFDRQGRKELLLTEGQLDRAFPLKREFFNDPDVQAVMQRDRDKRRTVKRTVRISKRQERFYVFVLSASENDN